jgi:RNA polymerase sigma-70 factor (ECF subfamily)
MNMSATSSALTLVNAESERAYSPPDIVDLYNAHGRYVWRRLQQMGVHECDLEDALQEVFVVAFRNVKNYDPNQAKVTTWLFGIALNVARNVTRGTRRREAKLDRDALPQDAVAGGTPEELLAHRQRQALLAELLATLPLEHRTTFVLFELEGLNGNEIAELMQVPVGTVRSRLFHARKTIESSLIERKNKISRNGVPLP